MSDGMRKKSKAAKLSVNDARLGIAIGLAILKRTKNPIIAKGILDLATIAFQIEHDAWEGN